MLTLNADDVLNEMQLFNSEFNRDHTLIVYMNRHIGKLAELLVESEVLDEVPESIPQFE